MSTLSNAGMAFPIPPDFDFNAWMTKPADIVPSDALDLKARNEDNIVVEIHNRLSIRNTRYYMFALDKTDMDVGLPLIGFWLYSERDLTSMTRSTRFCDSVGPLPTYLCQLVEGARDNLADAEAQERLTRERERSEREKLKSEKEKERAAPVIGSMVMSNPVVRTAMLRMPVIIPDIYLNSIFHRLHPPINWFTDEHIQFAEQHGQGLHPKQIRPIATAANANPKEVTVFDTAKMIKLWGNDETHECLSPLDWQQATLNFLAALISLCPPPSNPPVNNFADEFRLHREFFMNLKNFEKDYRLWYPFEREMRQDLMSGRVLFSEAHYAMQVQIILSAFQAVQYSPALSRNDTSSKRPADFASPEVRKVQRTSYDAHAGSSFRDQRQSFRDRDPQEPSRGPSCFICAGPHRVADHDPKSTKFSDGQPLFSCRRNGDLFTVKPFRGPEPRRLCGSFNVGRGCQATHSPQERLHVCSLCGKDHAALSRDPDCVRVAGGQHLP
ncbi:hypothetical protein B0H17DRAFT_1129096 [Mycena rosella]|uniref:Uncharacterized protein n=1 Tax=Mycena rosella TaxID=1033263 RepID=A0AAD7DXC0_MYCRO|nr:hypothetical protein B0H17DRAFT_1129096 [Mycena rosella]